MTIYEVVFKKVQEPSFQIAGTETRRRTVKKFLIINDDTVNIRTGSFHLFEFNSKASMAKTILIVDGNKGRLKRLSGMVSGLGYHVLQAASCAETLSFLASERSHAVLAGSRLPDGDIDGLVREIKRRFRDVEVVVVADEPWVIEALQHLAAGFIVKPFNPLLTGVLLDRAI